MHTAGRQFVITVINRAFTFLEQQGRWILKEGKQRQMKHEGPVRTDLGFCKSSTDGNEEMDVWAFDQGKKLQPQRLVDLGAGQYGKIILNTFVLTGIFQQLFNGLPISLCHHQDKVIFLSH